MAIDILHKVRKIIDLAESEEKIAKTYLAKGDKDSLENYEGHMASAAAKRQMAETLMQKYRIEQEDLLATDRTVAKPIDSRFVIVSGERNEEFDVWLYTMFLQIVEHCGCRGNAVYDWDTTPGAQNRRIKATVVGYEMDVAYAELLWSSARLTFGAHVDPRPSPDLSERENIYVMRRAGMPRKDVAQLLWGRWTHSNSAKVGKIFKEEALRRGENPDMMGRGFDNEVYRKAYAREFVWRVYDRLREARDAAGQAGGAIELSGRQERVDEAFYQIFPHLRPTPPEEQPTGEVKESDKKPAKVKGPTKAQMRREERLYYSPSARAGASAGRDAGSKVNIQRTTTGTSTTQFSNGDNPKEIA